MAETIGVAIDPNTRRTGLVLWRGPTPAEWRVIETAKADGPRYWLAMAKEITTALEGVFFSTSSPFCWVACEGLYLPRGENRNVATFETLARLVGTIEYWCYRYGITYLEGTTAEINAAIGFPARMRRDARERDLLAYARPRLKSRAPAELSVDEAAAYAVGVWALRQLERRALAGEGGTSGEQG